MPEAIGELIIAAAYWLAGTSIAAEEAAGFLTLLDYSVLGISSAAIVGTVAIEAASLGATTALAPSMKISAQKVNVRNAIQPRRRGTGRTRLGGTLALLKRSEITDDGILYAVVMFHSGKIDGIEEYWVGDQITRLDPTGGVTAVVGGAVYPARWLDGQRITIQTYLGEDSQTSNALLQAAFPGAWTDAHQLNGIAYAVLKANGTPLEDFAEVYSGIPSLSVVARLSPVWDPRDEAQDADDPTTWTWGRNAALGIMDYLWHADGMRQARDLIEAGINDWKEKADYCDDAIALIGGGTEARYTLDGAYDFTEPPKNTLGAMLAPIDGRVRLREDGAIVLDVGRFETPTAAETFGDADIISYVNFRRGAAKTDLKNEVRATYVSPGHNYQQQEADPWRDQASIDLDGLQTVTLPLEWCQSHRQVRQQQKVIAARLNPTWQGQIVLNARGLNLLGKRYMRLVLSDLGIDETFFIKPGAKFDLLNGGRCTLDIVSFPASAYEWTPAEEGESPENATPGDHGYVIPEGATSLTITARGAGGGGSDRGAGGGSECIKTIAIDPADEGTIIRFHVGRGGIGDAVTAFGVEEDGEASTVDGVVTAGTIAMVAGGGAKGTNSPGVGGTATGGDTNTPGSDGEDGDGGPSAAGAPANEKPGGGGDLQMDGADGEVIFEPTF